MARRMRTDSPLRSSDGYSSPACHEPREVQRKRKLDDFLAEYRDKKKERKESDDDNEYDHNEEEGDEQHDKKEDSYNEAEVLLICQSDTRETEWYLIPRKRMTTDELEAMTTHCIRGGSSQLLRRETWCDIMLSRRTGRASGDDYELEKSAGLKIDAKGFKGKDYTWDEHRIAPGHIVSTRGPKTHVFFVQFD